jgi:hypothetical protein
VDTTFIHFKTQKCTQHTEIVILLRERIVTKIGLGYIRTFQWSHLVEAIVPTAECPSVIDEVSRCLQFRS